MKKVKRFLSLMFVVGGLGAPGVSLGAQARYLPPVTVERNHVAFEIAADGTYTKTFARAYRIKTAKGAEDYGSEEFNYIGSQEEILSVDAWTVTPEGVRLPVLPGAIRDRDEDNSGGAAQFSDTRVKAIIFPQVTVGSLIEYKVVSRVHTTPYPGEFQQTLLLTPELAYEDWEARFALPEARRPYLHMRGVTGGLEKTVDGISHYRFLYRRTTTMKQPTRATGPIHFADYLMVSSMPDMQALGRVAKTFFEPNVEAIDEIRNLARQITAGAANDRTKVKALYNWVARNIRYVSVSLGKGRLVPHPASQVLANRYGDCKDHVVILESLLDAVGIASSPAMINSGASHLFAPIGIHYPINHVITYVPSLDLYLDSTDPFVPFGTLPLAVVDRPVILTALDRLGRTPSTKADDHVSRTEMNINIRTDGTISGRSYSRMTGYFDHAGRAERFSNQSQSEDAEITEHLLRFNESGTGSRQFPDPTDITKPYWVRAQFTLEPLANMPGRGGLPVPVGLAPGEIAGAGRNPPEAESTFPLQCVSRFVEERYVLNFPQNVSIEAIPADVQFQRGDVRYQSRFVQDGQKVTVRRTLRVQRASNVCGTKESRDWFAFSKVLQRDLRSQIIYR